MVLLPLAHVVLYELVQIDTLLLGELLLQVFASSLVLLYSRLDEAYKLLLPETLLLLLPLKFLSHMLKLCHLYTLLLVLGQERLHLLLEGGIGNQNALYLI